jgi:hypothetical protein
VRIDLSEQHHIHHIVGKAWDAMRSTFQAKHINDIIEDLLR